jgi:hypothetical protein
MKRRAFDEADAELVALLDMVTPSASWERRCAPSIRPTWEASAVVDQQFEVAAQILAAGLVPIVEPEVDIHCPEKAKAEALRAALLEQLDKLLQMRWSCSKSAERDDFTPIASNTGFWRWSAGRIFTGEGNRLRRNHGVVAEFLAGARERIVRPAIRFGIRRHPGCSHSSRRRRLEQAPPIWPSPAGNCEVRNQKLKFV